MNKEEFIEKARKVHGDKYDYSKVELTKVKDKVTIICPEHGEFIQEANSHLQGRGCPICAGKKFSLKNFINRANKIWNNKYDYSKVIYSGTNNKVTIICPEHGEFYQTISNHLKGQCGCKQCRGKSADFEVIRTKEDWIQQVHKKFGNKFDLSKVEWKGSREKVCIICPEHGEFWCLPYGFLQNTYGCPKCQTYLKYTTEEFINLCKNVHGDKYDYSEVEYTGGTNYITVGCPIHGKFQIRAQTFLKGGGCQECLYDSYRLTNDEFIERAKSVHGDRYNYDNVKYVNYQTPVTIICAKHGEFNQSPAAHLKGCNCPECALEDHIPSKGEYIIEEYLKHNKIQYKAQFKLISDKLARNSHIIYIDFVALGKDNKLKFIEYNGKQHYEYVPYFFSTEEDFQKQLRRDQVLRDYCTLNDKVDLIEIKYNLKEEQIIEILNNLFK